MPKPRDLTPRKVISLLKKHGFLLDHVTGSHYIFYHPETKRRITVAYHTRALSKGTLNAILKQAGISRKEP